MVRSYLLYLPKREDKNLQPWSGRAARKCISQPRMAMFSVIGWRRELGHIMHQLCQLVFHRFILYSYSSLTAYQRVVLDLVGDCHKKAWSNGWLPPSGWSNSGVASIFFGIQIEKGLFVDLPPLLMVVCYSRKRLLVGDAHGQLAGETMATPLLLDGFMENPKNGWWLGLALALRKPASFTSIYINDLSVGGMLSRWDPGLDSHGRVWAEVPLPLRPKWH